MSRKPVKAKEIIKFPEFYVIKDITIDNLNKILYALTSDGTILGKGLVKNSPINIEYTMNSDEKQEKRSTIVGMISWKKHLSKSFNNLSVSKDGRVLIISSSEELESEKNFVKNQIFFFELMGSEDPIFLGSCDVITKWEGSK